MAKRFRAMDSVNDGLECLALVLGPELMGVSFVRKLRL